MSLLAWYPLHKDLNDWSGNDNHLVSVDSSGSIVETETGIFGRCQERLVANGSNSYLQSTNVINVSAEFTMAGWVKAQASNNSVQGYFTLHDHYANAGVSISGERSNNKLVFAPAVGNGKERPRKYGVTDIEDRWAHLVFRYKDNHCMVFVDGELDQEFDYDMYTNPQKLCLFAWSVTHLGSSNYRPACKLNDVRIYDHAITDHEVQELSMALQARYTFQDIDPSFTNLIQNSSFNSATEIEPGTVNWDDEVNAGSYSVPNWGIGYNAGVAGASYIEHCRFVNFQGEICVKTNYTNQSWIGISHTVINNREIDPVTDPDDQNAAAKRNGRPFVLSLDVYVDELDENGEMPYWQIGLYRPNIQSSTGGKSFAGQKSAKPTKVKTWERVSVTFYTDAGWNWSDPNAVASLYFYGYYGPKGVKYFKNPQLEFLSDVPNEFKESDTTNRLIYEGNIDLTDVSGMGYNAYAIQPQATIDQDFTSIDCAQLSRSKTSLLTDGDRSPSPRFDKAVYNNIPGSEYDASGYDTSSGFGTFWRVDEYIPPQNSLTVTFWIDNKKQKDRDAVVVSCSSGWSSSKGGFELGYGLGDSTYVGIGGTQVAQSTSYFPNATDGWAFVAIVCDLDENETRFYRNGVLVGTNAAPSEIGLGYGNLHILNTGGSINSNETFFGGVSDLRVYGTALSEDKVSKLYRTTASISSDGRFHASEFIEGILYGKDTTVDVHLMSGSNNSLIEVDGVAVPVLGTRGLQFAYYDTSFTLRGYGTFDTYSGTSAHRYWRDGDLVVDQSGGMTLSEACTAMKDALVDMESGWTLLMVREDASATANTDFSEYLTEHFQATENHAITTRGTWSLVSVKDGEKIHEDWEGLRYNDAGSVVYYEKDVYISLGYNKPSVQANGAVTAGTIIEGLYKPSLVDYSTWEVGATEAPGVKGSHWERNGAIEENLIQIKENPWGDRDVVWTCQHRPEQGSHSSDGGFNSGRVNIDNTKSHRFSVWLKRPVDGNGSWYLGNYGHDEPVETLTGAPNSNPYFISSRQGYNNEWFLAVGYVYPVGTTSDIYTDAGVYSVTGEHIAPTSHRNFRCSEGTTVLRIRAYLFYDSYGTQQYFYRPRIDVIDGTEPSLDELIKGTEHPPIINEYVEGVYVEDTETRFSRDGILFTKEVSEL